MIGKRDFQKLRRSMIENQILRRGIVDKRVLNSIQSVPRHKFVQEMYIAEAYEDHPLPIGFGQTISQPFIVALMTEQLCLHESDKVLEIGTGSGYQTAILAGLCEFVFSIERVPELADRARKILEELDIKNVQIIVKDGTYGYEEKAPFDRIIVTAAAPEIPEPYKEQLKEGGKIVIPIGSRWSQELQLWVKNKAGFSIENVLPVVFVPLYGDHGWDLGSR